jgi:hypothetical protein
MTYKLIATVTHKSWDEPIIHTFFYQGNSLDEIIGKLDTLDQHKHNLLKHSRTAFKDVNGVKHRWKLELMPDLN